LVNEELEIGARALAVPLHESGGRTVAAINVSCYARRVSAEHMRSHFLPEMLKTAQAIESEMQMIHAGRG
ncbi:MAG: IclR family transcriptional regulator, partial [Burkholderiales bacterium]|nr:IclR family transcriptional regulator [Burkholderiales bacterium]